MPKRLNPARMPGAPAPVPSTPITALRAVVSRLFLPVREDCVVLGRLAAMSAASLRLTLRATSSSRFVRVPVRSGVVQLVLVREEILKRVSAKELGAFLEARVLPLVSEHDILKVSLRTTTLVEEKFESKRAS